jgi:hypothetical protein
MSLIRQCLFAAVALESSRSRVHTCNQRARYVLNVPRPLSLTNESQFLSNFSRLEMQLNSNKGVLVDFHCINFAEGSIGYSGTS